MTRSAIPDPSQPLVLLLAAVHAELDAVVRRLGLTWYDHHAEGIVRGRLIVATVTGIGARRALNHVNTLLETYAVERVVHVGFAGGLDPSLDAGEVMRIGNVCNDQGETVTIEGTDGPLLLTVDRLAASVEEKRKLYEATGAAAVDMETYPVAAALHQREVPVLALRVISDAADTALPRTALQWIDPQGRASVTQAVLWLLRHPGECLALWRLSRRVRHAAENLAVEIERLFDVENEPQQMNTDERR